MPLRPELIQLFGPATWRESERIEPEKVDASAVRNAAGALLSLAGQPSRQVEHVRGLPPELAAALCRWLADPSFWGLVANVTKH